jgi:hypothetical protein
VTIATSTETMDTVGTPSADHPSPESAAGLAGEMADLTGRVHREVRARVTAKNEVHPRVIARNTEERGRRLGVPMMVVAALAITSGLFLSLGMTGGASQKVRSGGGLTASNPTTSAPQTTSTTPATPPSAPSSVISTTSTTFTGSTTPSAASAGRTGATTSTTQRARGAGATTPSSPQTTSSPPTPSSAPTTSSPPTTSTTSTTTTTTTTTSSTTSTTAGR